MIPFAIIAALVITLASCLLFLSVYAFLTMLDHLWRRHRLRQVLPPPTTLQARRVTDMQRWRALRGSGANRFKLSEYR